MTSMHPKTSFLLLTELLKNKYIANAIFCINPCASMESQYIFKTLEGNYMLIINLAASHFLHRVSTDESFFHFSFPFQDYRLSIHL